MSTVRDEYVRGMHEKCDRDTEANRLSAQRRNKLRKPEPHPTRKSKRDGNFLADSVGRKVLPHDQSADIPWGDLCERLPIELVAKLCASKGKPGTKLEIAANSVMILGKRPELPWERVYKLAVSMLLRERSGRYNASGHDIATISIPPCTVGEWPEEELAHANTPLMRLMPVAQLMLNDGDTFGDRLAQGLPLADASRLAGITAVTGIRRIQRVAAQLLKAAAVTQ